MYALKKSTVLKGNEYFLTYYSSLHELVTWVVVIIIESYNKNTLYYKNQKRLFESNSFAGDKVKLPMTCRCFDLPFSYNIIYSLVMS